MFPKEIQYEVLDWIDVASVSACCNTLSGFILIYIVMNLKWELMLSNWDMLCF